MCGVSVGIGLAQRKGEIIMAAKKVVVGGSSGVTASQLSDLFRQIGDRSITGTNMQAFLEHRDPFSLRHIVLDWKKAYIE